MVRSKESMEGWTVRAAGELFFRPGSYTRWDSEPTKPNPCDQTRLLDSSELRGHPIPGSESPPRQKCPGRTAIPPEPCHRRGGGEYAACDSGPKFRSSPRAAVINSDASPHLDERWALGAFMFAIPPQGSP